MQQIIFAGFGGQGILSAGRILAYASMFEGKNVSWLPSYGPEMRGGTANCHVIVSGEEIGSPIINRASAAIVMSKLAFDKFEKMVVPGGLFIIDSSIVDNDPVRKDIAVYKIPASEIASDVGNLTFANIVILGHLIRHTGIVSRENIEGALKKVLSSKKHHLIPQEMTAFDRGFKYM